LLLFFDCFFTQLANFDYFSRLFILHKESSKSKHTFSVISSMAVAEISLERIAQVIIFLHDFSEKLDFLPLISRTYLLMEVVLQHFISLQVTRSHVAAAKCLGNHAGDHRGSRRFHIAPPTSQRCSCYEAGWADQQNERYNSSKFLKVEQK